MHHGFRSTAMLAVLLLGLVACADVTAGPTFILSAEVRGTTNEAVATIGGAEEPGYVDGPGALARFDSPAAGAVDGKGILYFSDRQNHRIRRVDLRDNAHPVSTLAGNGSPDFADGPGATASFNDPVGLAVTASGTVFVADHYNHRIRKIVTDAAGVATVTTIAGGEEPGGQDGVGVAATFNHPFGLALDETGALYVSELFGQTIRRIADPEGVAMVATMAGATEELDYADGPGRTARFSLPSAIAADGSGHLYVMEDEGCRLRRIDLRDPAHPVTTLTAAGDGICGFLDGPLNGARFQGTHGLAFDGAHGSPTLWVADTGNGVIRRIDLTSGQVTSPSGSATDTAIPFRDGALADARFDTPEGIAVGPDGVLYVLDANRLRFVRPTR